MIHSKSVLCGPYTAANGSTLTATTATTNMTWPNRLTIAATATNSFTTTWPCANDWISVIQECSKITAGNKTIELPDGAQLIVDDLGNYKIEDKNAKVTYQANKVREFSPHLNASDLLAQFVKYIGGLGVRQDELLGLPIELFINWLVIEAAERDGDSIPSDIVRPADHKVIRQTVRPQCLVCGRFICKRPIAVRFPFCGIEHARRYIDLNKLAAS